MAVPNTRDSPHNEALMRVQIPIESFFIRCFIYMLFLFKLINTIENYLNTFLKKKKLSCTRLLAYDIIFWVLSSLFTIYIFRERVIDFLKTGELPFRIPEYFFGSIPPQL